MPPAQDSYSMAMPSSPPPPQSLTSYSQFIHEHTKRQMEANGSLSARSSTSSTTSSSRVLINGAM
ncbi:hypothetical protein E4U42_002432 [Claviceps africana]|uniref:Uncharacterized protein n=1 Tax=Claviceps africana TaxID=83212 RepID=A0A8K0J8A4_9HYPO|nr:hypothetical protein E4U42_002432 [Claviceps africana]